MSASYRLCDHTADVAVEATGPDLSSTFAAVADGLAAAACDPEEVPPDGDRFAVSVRAESREALLFDYLDELIYERDVRGVLPVDNEARVAGPGVGDEGREDERERDDGHETGDGREGNWNRKAAGGREADDEWVVDASARGVPLDRIAAREVKAVTYSEMAVEEREDGWYAYVVFDV